MFNKLFNKKKVRSFYPDVIQEFSWTVFTHEELTLLMQLDQDKLKAILSKVLGLRRNTNAINLIINAPSSYGNNDKKAMYLNGELEVSKYVLRLGELAIKEADRRAKEANKAKSGIR